MGGVNQGISRVEGCVLKEEIVFVWQELVQKDEFGLNRKWEELTKVFPG